MTDDEAKALEPMMTANLSRTIDFVKFGEAKNAALLTFASAWILASANVAVGKAGDVGEVRMALILGVPLIAIAAFLALISFLPRTDLNALRRAPKTNPRPNYLYFGDLSQLPADRCHQRFRDRFLSDGKLNDDYFDDLGCQIIVNAKVAAQKFFLFRWGVRSLILGLLIYAVAAAVLVISRWLGGH